jgi:tetratricopeptide (TPR) repeat protein
MKSRTEENPGCRQGPRYYHKEIIMMNQLYRILAVCVILTLGLTAGAPRTVLAKDAKSYNDQGLEALKKNQYDQAITDFNQAIKLNPKFDLAYNNRGFAYYSKKNYDKALADFNKAIALNPKYAVAYSNRGMIYSAKRDFNKAFADYNKAIQLDPKNSIAYNYRGSIYYQKKDHNKALRILTKP